MIAFRLVLLIVALLGGVHLSTAAGQIQADKAVPVADPKACHVQSNVWLCPADPQRQLAAPGALLVPDSQGDRVMSLDATTGELLNPNYIPADPTHLSTPLNAILAPDAASILVSDQVEDVVQHYALDGSYLGVFAPSTGVSTTVLDNIRGITLRPNGNLLVTVGAGGNINAVAEFNPSGVYLGQFIAAGAGGLASPYDVYFRSGDLLASSNGDGIIRRYDAATGAYLSNFVATAGFPQQIAEAANGNVLTANFTINNEGVLEYTAAGMFVGRYDGPNMNSYRGVYELPNGNLLTTIPIGVYEINRNSQIVDIKVSGAQSRYIEHARVPALRLEKTVGVDPTTCATATQLTVVPGTEVVYCYRVINTGSSTLTTHMLIDNQLGALLNGFNLTLLTGESAFITATATLTRTTTNLATWTARDTANLAVQDGDSVTVVVSNPTATPTETATPSITFTPTETSTPSPTPTASATATLEPSTTATPEATASATVEPSTTATPAASATTPPQPTASATAQPSATAEPSITVAPEPSTTPTSAVVPTATLSPTATASASPTLPTATRTVEPVWRRYVALLLR